MRFARWVFWTAGVYGLIVLTPQFFLEERMGRDYPPPVSHPEFFYGFAGVALAWQVLFLVIGSNPPRFRPVMLLAVLAKMSFVLTTLILYLKGRVTGVVVGLTAVDAAWAVLFALAWLVTPKDY